MILAGVAALLLLAFGDEQERQPGPRPAQGAITVHQQQIIVRMPVGIRPAPPAASLIRWEEHRGPRCIAWARILGAGLLGQNSVDLIFRDGTRVRARLERRCPALDYYRGFYLPATVDGLICADRDSVRSRTGGQCQIDQFRSLRARPAR
ncbi:MAG TPA: hypothetical protein VGW40_08310 [Allosphingosinicella sp.]|nr:hypothetical protein [Allosphingosinicella sp.]